MISPAHLRDLVIAPTLRHLDQHREEAVSLLLGTAAVESGGGTSLRSTAGRQWGLYHMSAFVHDELWREFLPTRIEVRKIESLLAPGRPGIEQLAWNFAYATAMAWMWYCRGAAAVPPADNLYAQAHFWKRYYHPAADKKLQHYIFAYDDYVVTPSRDKRVVS